MNSKRLTSMIIGTLLLFVSSAFPISALGQGDAEGVAGKVMYRNGSEQPFTSFRCSYYSRIGHSVNNEALIADSNGEFSAVTLDKIERIAFPGPPSEGVRYGTVSLFDRRTLEAFFYVEQCEWANGKAARGNLGDYAISALVFKVPSKR